MAIWKKTTMNSLLDKVKVRIEEFRKEHPWIYKGAVIGLISLVGIFLLSWIFYLSVLIGVFGKVPNKASLAIIKNYTASRVYSADGEVLGRYFIENRTNISYEEISPNIINALIATEDVRYYQHEGVDNRSLLRVFAKTLLLGDESSGGGSTITQQLAKNLFKRKDYSILSVPVNKLREAIVAKRLEEVYTKEEILTLYLNTVPFSGNIFGIETATKNFFDTTPQDIALEDAAVLIGMLKANTSYNPVLYPERSKERRNTVLNQMVRYEYISRAEADSLKELPIEPKFTLDSNNEGLATYFREKLRVELDETLKDLKKPDGTSYDLYADGLNIYTTLDSRMQRYAEEAVKEQMAHLQKQINDQLSRSKVMDAVVQDAAKRSGRYITLADNGLSEKEILTEMQKPMPMKIWSWDGQEQKEMSPLDSIRHYQSFLNTGFLAMDPGSGHIKAWVGGINHRYFKYSHITARRQVGSTFKPIVYAAALEDGIDPCEYIPNERVTYAEYQDWTPQNSDGRYGGYYSMTGGITNSVNTVAVDLIMQTGVNRVINLARAMGIKGKLPQVPSIALGAADLSLLEMVKAYAVFPNRGITTEPVYILRIEDSEGNIIKEFEQTVRKERVLSTETADIMNYMLRNVVNSGTAARLNSYGLGVNVAGKTGTTQAQADGWFIGYTPKLVAGAWVGADDRRVRFSTTRLGQGANTALPIYGKFMNKVMKDPRVRKDAAGNFIGLDSVTFQRINCEPFVYVDPNESFWDKIFGSGDRSEYEYDGDDPEREERPRDTRRRRPVPLEDKDRLIDKLKDIFN